MKTIAPVLAFFAASILSLFFVLRQTQSRQAEASGPGKPARPVVVELFTSEGCSSCPPADALLQRLDEEQRVGNAGIIALEEHVDYWDRLGWRDPFSAGQWTERQQDYADSFGNAGVYTPQMVVDGRTEFVGSSEGRVRSAIDEAARQPKAEIILSDLNAVAGGVRLQIEVKMLPGATPSEAGVWLAATESGLHSKVKAGENSGEDLHHAAVVRSLRKVGDAKAGQSVAFSGEREVRLDAGWKRENLRVVVFVQDPKSRHILGAAAARLIQ